MKRCLNLPIFVNYASSCRINIYWKHIISSRRRLLQESRTWTCVTPDHDKIFQHQTVIHSGVKIKARQFLKMKTETKMPYCGFFSMRQLIIIVIHCCLLLFTFSSVVAGQQTSSNQISLLSSSLSPNQTTCPTLLEGRCLCFDHTEDLPPFHHRPTNSPTQGLRVECSNMTGLTLHHDIDRISAHFRDKKYSILALSVKDSRMDDLNGLPSGLVDLRHLTLDRTGIDLEQVRESSEILKDLKTFRVLRETFTEIPENFFHDLHHVVTLALNDVGIAAISEDGFKYLEDSLKNLSLRANKLRSIPVAVEFLPLLESLDLSDNEITNVADDMTRRLESNLRSLSRLTINTINCTCSFGSSEFVEWIRSHAIQGVTCRHPKKLQGRDISSAHIQDFCSTSSVDSKSCHRFISIVCLVSMLLSLFKSRLF